MPPYVPYPDLARVLAPNGKSFRVSYSILKAFEKIAEETLETSTTQRRVLGDSPIGLAAWLRPTLRDELDSIQRYLSGITKGFSMNRFLQLVRESSNDLRIQPDDNNTLRRSKVFTWLLTSVLAGGPSQECRDFISDSLSLRDEGYPCLTHSFASQWARRGTPEHGSFPALTHCLTGLNTMIPDLSVFNHEETTYAILNEFFHLAINIADLWVYIWDGRLDHGITHHEARLW
jgi:hypothetical protein